MSRDDLYCEIENLEEKVKGLEDIISNPTYESWYKVGLNAGFVDRLCGTCEKGHE